MKKLFIFITIFTIVGVGVVGNTILTAAEKVLAVEGVPGGEISPPGTVGSKWEPPEIYIKAINPGYTVDGKSNVGEMIEIGRRNSDEMMSLAGYKIDYTNSSGKEVTLLDLSKYLWMAGETLTFRLASSPEHELANLQYTTTLAMKAGPLSIVKNEVKIDSICWTGKSGCNNGFESKSPTTLVRDMASGVFGHVPEYEAGYVPEALAFADGGGGADETIVASSQCKGLEFSEILSYYESLQSEQFIEFYNSTVESMMLDGCMVKYKNKYYPLAGMVGPEGYYVRYLEDFKLTKNPTTSNVLELVDVNGEVIDRLEYPNGQRKGAAYALIGYDGDGKEVWKVTYAPTPGEANNYQEFRTCEAGKVINEATGNCVKITSVMEKICGEGQYLNILTGRCKKYDTSASVTECKEGYYYYEATGRCRKIQENDGADYTLVPETYEEKSSFVALYLILGVVGVGLVYVVYEFRHEIGRFFRRVFKK